MNASQGRKRFGRARRSASLELGTVDESPGALLAQQARDQGVVHGMAGAFSDDMADQGMAQQRQISDQVENLVAAKLVRKPQAFGIHHSLPRQHHRVLKRPTPDQTAVTQYLNFLQEAKGACRG